MGPGGAEQRDGAVGDPGAASSRSSGGSTVRLGMGRVRSGKTTTTRRAPATSWASGGPAQRADQGLDDGALLVGEPGQLGGQR